MYFVSGIMHDPLYAFDPLVSKRKTAQEYATIAITLRIN